MSISKDFKETIIARAQTDSVFRQNMLVEAVNELLADNIDVAKAMLRDYINATITFNVLAKELHKNPKSIQRMLGPAGNPTTSSLFSMMYILQQKEGIALHVSVD